MCSVKCQLRVTFWLLFTATLFDRLRLESHTSTNVPKLPIPPKIKPARMPIKDTGKMCPWAIHRFLAVTRDWVVSNIVVWLDLIYPAVSVKFGYVRRIALGLESHFTNCVRSPSVSLAFDCLRLTLALPYTIWKVTNPYPTPPRRGHLQTGLHWYLLHK